MNNMVLAVRLPVQNEAPRVLEYNIKEEKSSKFFTLFWSCSDYCTESSCDHQCLCNLTCNEQVPLVTGSRSCFYGVVQLIFPAASLPQVPLWFCTLCYHLQTHNRKIKHTQMSRPVLSSSERSCLSPGGSPEESTRH